MRSKPGHLVVTGTEFHAAMVLNYYPFMDEDRLNLRFSCLKRIVRVKGREKNPTFTKVLAYFSKPPSYEDMARGTG